MQHDKNYCQYRTDAHRYHRCWSFFDYWIVNRNCNFQHRNPEPYPHKCIAHLDHLIPKRNQLLLQSNQPESSVCLLLVCFCLFSNQIMYSVEFLYPLIPDMAFCYVLTKASQIFRTQLHRLSVLLLLILLRKCDILRLPDNLYTLP